MSFEAVVLQVLIASPTDVSQDRDHAEAAIHAWNRDRTVGRKVVLLPLRWETGSVPELHAEGPQAVINEQLVGGTDIVIALFHGRFGAGGAGEEIEKARALGAQVHVWFSEAPIPHDADMDELQKVRDFQAILKGRGLLGTYASADDLRAKVRTALEYDVDQLTIAASVIAEESGTPPHSRAVLRLDYRYRTEHDIDKRGKIRTKRRGERLVVENIGTVAAEQVSIRVRPLGQGEAPPLRGSEAPFLIIQPHGEASLPLIMHMGVAQQVLATVSWREGDEAHTEQHTVSLM